MMIYLIVALIGVSVSAVVMLAAQLAPAQPRAVKRRLAELEQASGNPFGNTQRRQRQAQRDRFEGILQELGQWVETRQGDGTSELRQRLVQAGYRQPNASAVFSGVRVVLPIVLAVAGLLLAPAFGAAGTRTLLAAACGAVAGWILPSFVLDKKMKARQMEIQKALPDGLDMLVVCVEAGLGLNQAIVRVSEEVGHLSQVLSEELALVNLEIRAGTPREDALRALGDRTGVEDVRSLTAMLIQTDRFGTSIAQALRVHADTLRVRRRQRAEEAAAKTSVKLLFPLVMFIFPSLFVVILGPAVLQIMKALSNT